MANDLLQDKELKIKVILLNDTVKKMLSLAQRAYLKVSFSKNTFIFNSLSCRRSFAIFF